MSNQQIKKGDRPAIGVSAMCELCEGWKQNEKSIDAPEGYNVGDYFNSRQEYMGADEDGIEPVFRDMTPEELAEYKSGEASFPISDGVSIGLHGLNKTPAPAKYRA